MVKAVRNENTQVIHAVDAELSSDRGTIYKTICGIDALLHRGYRPVEGVAVDCATCRQVMAKTKVAKQSPEVILVVDTITDEIFEADNLSKLIKALKVDHNDEEIIEELSDGGNWIVYRARCIKLIPETETIVNLKALQEEE